jgi:methyl-accepting chemotaxis protein
MRNMKLTTKLIGGFLIVAAVVLVVGLVGWNGISTAMKSGERMNRAESIAKQLVQREVDHFVWARKVGEFQRNENMTELGVETDDHNCAFGKWYYGEDRKKVEAEIPGISDLLRKIEEPHKKLHDSAKELERLLKRGKEYRKEAITYYGTVTSSSLKDVQTIFGEIIPKVENHVAEAKNATQIQTHSAKIISLIGMGVGTLLALALGIFLSFSISRPINRIIEGMADGADQVAAAASQVSSASQSLAEGASEQAAGLEETSASIEEMTSMTRQNADNASQANILMTETSKVVDGTNRSMTELTQSMREISAASEETAKIIKTIDEIAFQTNLLALNAAVEAARAGEAGAGFAVVADEVRNLAMRAAEAAKSTSKLIEGTVKKIKNGSDTVAKANEAFANVAGGAKRVGKLVDEITAASQEQAQGIEQINNAVSEMDKVVQQNAASAEESASASEQMNAQAQLMKEFVNQLIVLVGGRGNSVGSPKQGLTGKDEDTLSTVSRQPDGAVRKTLVALAKKTKGTGLRTGAYHKQKELKPEQLIPMEEEDFKEF